MLTTLVVIVHVIVCVALVLIVLLQTGKGADIGAVFGGGSSNTVFGSTGATTFLSKVTIGAAVTFMVTSIILSYFHGQKPIKIDSVMEEQPAATAPAPEAPKAPTAPAEPTQPAPTGPLTETTGEAPQAPAE
jgi:preprotein translocase subunit SecG